jgi:hypothetical protein
MSHKDTEQSTIERSFYNTWWHNTNSLIRWSLNEWPSVFWGGGGSHSVCRYNILRTSWTSNKPAQWTFDIGNMDLQEFHDERVPNRQTIHNLVNKRRSTGSLIDTIQKYKHWVLTEENLDDTGAKLEHTPTKSLRSLAQEAGVSNSKC